MMILRLLISIFALIIGMRNVSVANQNRGCFYKPQDHLFRLDKTLYIGDDPRDVDAALNAGTDYILISEEKTSIDNHYNFVDIKSYFSLVEALDSIKAKLS